MRLKQKLKDAGLFNLDHKKTLPAFPSHIGIISSPHAAALRDILITLKRRAPHVHIIIYPTPVQGNGSAEKIIQAITTASSRKECDVLILARGGGSMEDLWSFNDEHLAYAIAECVIPIITGIGHETDFTIADFVADLRAATPTAAAEIAVSARSDLMQQIENYAAKLQFTLQRQIHQQYQTLDMLSRRLISPLIAIRNERLKLSSLHIKIKHALAISTQQAYFQFEQLKQKWIKHAPQITNKRNQLQQVALRLQHQAQRHLTHHQQSLNTLTTQLELLDPQRTLERGYAIVLDQKGKIVCKTNQFKAPSNVTVKVSDGEVGLGVITVQTHL